jgi:hypothetical protein
VPYICLPTYTYLCFGVYAYLPFTVFLHILAVTCAGTRAFTHTYLTRASLTPHPSPLTYLTHQPTHLVTRLIPPPTGASGGGLAAVTSALDGISDSDSLAACTYIAERCRAEGTRKTLRLALDRCLGDLIPSG